MGTDKRDVALPVAGFPFGRTHARVSAQHFVHEPSGKEQLPVSIPGRAVRCSPTPLFLRCHPHSHGTPPRRCQQGSYRFLPDSHTTNGGGQYHCHLQPYGPALCHHPSHRSLPDRHIGRNVGEQGRSPLPAPPLGECPKAKQPRRKK